MALHDESLLRCRKLRLSPEGIIRVQLRVLVSGSALSNAPVIITATDELDFSRFRLADLLGVPGRYSRYLRSVFSSSLWHILC